MGSGRESEGGVAPRECWEVVRILAVGQAANSVVLVAALCIAVLWVVRTRKEREG